MRGLFFVTPPIVPYVSLSMKNSQQKLDYDSEHDGHAATNPTASGPATRTMDTALTITPAITINSIEKIRCFHHGRVDIPPGTGEAQLSLV